MQGKTIFVPHTIVFVANGFICPLNELINTVRPKKAQSNEDCSLP
jgi:hypothetical protein